MMVFNINNVWIWNTSNDNKFYIKYIYLILKSNYYYLISNNNNEYYVPLHSTINLYHYHIHLSFLSQLNIWYNVSIIRCQVLIYIIIIVLTYLLILWCVVVSAIGFITTAKLSVSLLSCNIKSMQCCYTVK